MTCPDDPREAPRARRRTQCMIVGGYDHTHVRPNRHEGVRMFAIDPWYWTRGKTFRVSVCLTLIAIAIVAIVYLMSE